MVLMGFDYGIQRTGIAIGNQLTGIATPHTTLTSKQGQPDWDSISRLIKEWRPQKLIVGLPLYLDQTESDLTKAARRFANRLHGRYGLPVETIQEQLSSREAEQRLKQARQQGRKKKIQKSDIDQLAAAIILESWLAENPAG
ncbi:MAG: Holliday junction resolvase RuvX [bacterium]